MIRVHPLIAWFVVLLAFSITGLMWVISAPIVQALMGATEGYVNEQAESVLYMTRLEFIAIPIVVDILLVVWAFLVTTRRQQVVTGYYG